MQIVVAHNRSEGRYFVSVAVMTTVLGSFIICDASLSYNHATLSNYAMRMLTRTHDFSCFLGDTWRWLTTHLSCANILHDDFIGHVLNIC